MFAVIRTGGKQYRVARDDEIVVEKLSAEPGATVEIGDVLMIGEPGKAPKVGTPVLEKAKVFAEVVEQTRDDKIIVFKKNRRKGYRRKAGHRQEVTVLRVTDVSASGRKSAAKAKGEAKPEAAKEPEPGLEPEITAAPEAVAEAAAEAATESKE